MIRKILFCLLFLILFYFEIKTKIVDSFSVSTKIAIVTKKDFHLECVGFICELFKNYEVHLFHVPERNNENYIGYFKKIYPNLQNFSINLFTQEKEQNYIKIIKLTSYDSFNIHSKDKSITLVHFNRKNDILNYKKNIIISPLVKIDRPSIYILPIYRGQKSKNQKTKSIIFIGRKFNNEINEFALFIQKINYKLIFFSRKKTDQSNKKLLSLVNSNKIEFNYGKNVEFLVNKLKNSSFIYIDKKDDRFSGAISLALSHNIPMIIDKFQQEKYKFPAITYEKNINEIVPKLNSFSDHEYNHLLNDQAVFTENILNNYSEKLNLLLN